MLTDRIVDVTAIAIIFIACVALIAQAIVAIYRERALAKATHREFNTRRYPVGVTAFALNVRWSDGKQETMDWLPEYLVDELDVYFEEMEGLRAEGRYEE